MWNFLPVSIYTTPEFRSQELAGGEFYFATIEDFEIAIDTRGQSVCEILLGLYIRDDFTA